MHRGIPVLCPKAAARAMEGAVPYRDFGYTQTPLFPYLLGAALKCLGFGILEFRTLNVALSAAAAVLALVRNTRASGSLVNRI